MKKLLLTATALVALAAPALADVYDDPLHMSCAACLTDNGTFTPNPNGTFTDVGIASSPPGTAVTGITLKLLIPDTFSVGLGFTDSVAATGIGGGTLSLPNGLSIFNTGTLETTFLGIPSIIGAQNPIGAFLPSTNAVLAAEGQGPATGFFVATATLNALGGSLTLAGPGAPSVLDLTLGSINGGNCGGCWLLADGITPQGDITTAPSAALLSTFTASPVPLPAAVWLFGGALGLGGLLLRRRKSSTSVL